MFSRRKALRRPYTMDESQQKKKRNPNDQENPANPVSLIWAIITNMLIIFSPILQIMWFFFPWIADSNTFSLIDNNRYDSKYSPSYDFFRPTTLRPILVPAGIK